jgi:integrase
VHVTGVTLHSLRHCCGQWAVNAGVLEAQVQAALRHETASTTRIYTLQKARGQVARALAGVFLSRVRPAGLGVPDDEVSC